MSPKKFLQYTSIEYVKKVLDETRVSLLDVAGMTGLSGMGRLLTDKACKVYFNIDFIGFCFI